jgi:pimeloyl-ACP methyl ester carboxylesterase
MTTLDRDGVTIYYEDHGSGPAMLLTHGYASTSQMWAGQVEAFKDRCRVITWDMRGHGQSDSPEDQSLYSEAHTVADMKAILDACGVERAVVGGLSLGGYMSMAFNLAHPAMVRALMLFDTGPGYKNDKARDGWNETAGKRAEAFERKGLEALGSGDEVRVSTHRSAEGLARAARGMLAQVDSRVIESLPDISVPTLVLVGSNDTPYLAATDYMANKIPGATRVVIDDAGHASNIHQPAAFNDAVAGFLARLPAE